MTLSNLPQNCPHSCVTTDQVSLELQLDPIVHVEQLHAASVQHLVCHGAHINEQPELVLCVVLLVVHVGRWQRPQRIKVPPGYFSKVLGLEAVAEDFTRATFDCDVEFFPPNFSVSLVPAV